MLSNVYQRRTFWMEFFATQQPTATNLLLKSFPFLYPSYLFSFFFLAPIRNWDDVIQWKNIERIIVFPETKNFPFFIVNDKKEKSLLYSIYLFHVVNQFKSKIVTFGFDSTMKTLNVRFAEVFNGQNERRRRWKKWIKQENITKGFGFCKKKKKSYRMFVLSFLVIQVFSWIFFFFFWVCFLWKILTNISFILPELFLYNLNETTYSGINPDQVVHFVR